jgi:hypothetical protein
MGLMASLELFEMLTLRIPEKPWMKAGKKLQWSSKCPCHISTHLHPFLGEGRGADKTRAFQREKQLDMNRGETINN